MPDYQFINYQVTNRVAIIAFNSPKTLNALNQKMRIELIDVLQKIELDDDVRAVILTGEGRGFCVGADLSEGMPGHDSFVQQCEAEYEPWLMAIHDSSKLFIAAVNGAAAGIGAATVMNCDLVVMADDAYLYQAFSAIGLMPDGGANWQLVQKLGYQRAIELAIDAGRIEAKEAQELGLANKVVPADNLLTEAQSLAEKIARGAPLAQAAVKKVMRNVYSMSYEDTIRLEAIKQSKLIQSEDSRNAIESFFAKKTPIFNGK